MSSTPGISNMAKHDLIRSSLFDLIAKLPAGAALPPERQLAAELSVARMTLRRVIDILVESGELVRYPGRGTFVAAARFINPSGEGSFRAELERHGMTASSRTVEFAEQDAGARLAQKLHVSPGDRIIRAVRLRLADGEPVALERIHVPAALVAGMTGADLEEGSFYALLRERYGITVARSSRVVQATSVNEAEAELLSVAPHSPAFYIQSTRYDEAGRIVEYLDAIYRGDRYRFASDGSDATMEPRLTIGIGSGIDAFYGN